MIKTLAKVALALILMGITLPFFMLVIIIIYALIKG